MQRHKTELSMSKLHVPVHMRL